MKILYVEDNDDNIYMLENRLKRAGFTVVIARDGAQGVAMASTEQPDLILMDLSLPVLDGWEATRRLKGDGRTSHIPVVALTAHDGAGDLDQAMKAGCDWFVPKPCPPDSLIAEVRRVLAGQPLD